MKQSIEERLAKFYMDSAFPRKNNGFRKPMPFRDFIEHLQNMLVEYEENGYWGITCECKSDWDQPDWLVISGRRQETEEECQARLDKEKSDAEKKEAKRLARIKKLEQELNELKGG